MRFKFGIGVAVICTVAFASSGWTHHSHGNYEDTFMDIEGIVKEVHLVVPHSWIYLEVKDAKGGEPQMWALEATGRTGLQRVGITRTMSNLAITSKRDAIISETAPMVVCWDF